MVINVPSDVVCAVHHPFMGWERPVAGSIGDGDFFVHYS